MEFNQSKRGTWNVGSREELELSVGEKRAWKGEMKGEVRGSFRVVSQQSSQVCVTPGGRTLGGSHQEADCNLTAVVAESLSWC